MASAGKNDRVVALLGALIGAAMGAATLGLSTGSVRVSISPISPLLSQHELALVGPFGLSIVLIGWMSYFSWREYRRIAEELKTSKHAEKAVGGILILAVSIGVLLASKGSSGEIFGLSTSETPALWFAFGVAATTPVFIRPVGDFIYLFCMIFICICSIVLRITQTQDDFAGLLWLIVGVVLGTVLIAIFQHTMHLSNTSED